MSQSRQENDYFLFESHMQLQFNLSKEQSQSEIYHSTGSSVTQMDRNSLFYYQPQGCCNLFSFSSLTVLP